MSPTTMGIIRPQAPTPEFMIPSARADPFLKPVADGVIHDDARTTAPAESNQDDACIEQPERLRLAQQNETGADRQDSQKTEFPRSIAIDEKTDDWGKETHLESAETHSEGDFGIAPAEFFDERIKISGKTEIGNGTDIETDKQTGGYNPPAVIDLAEPKREARRDGIIHGWDTSQVHFGLSSREPWSLGQSLL